MNLKVIYSSLLILLVSCTSELPQAPDHDFGQEPGVPVSFTYAVESKVEFESRAPIQYTYLPDDSQIGIYALGGTVNVNDEFIYTANSNPWIKGNLQPYFLNACYKAKTNADNEHRLAVVGQTGTFPNTENAALEFYAYYPFTTNVQFNQESIVPISPAIPIKVEQDLDQTPDYLYTGPIVAKASTNETTQLKFKHALAKLEIYITTEKEFTGRNAPKVTHIILGTNNAQEGTMKLSTGEITPKGNSEYWDNFRINISEDNQRIQKAYNNTSKCGFLLFPDKNPLYYLRLYVRTAGNQDKIYEYELNIKNTPSLQDIELKQGYVTKLYLNYTLDY